MLSGINPTDTMVLPSRFVTKDMDDLRYNSAAATQIPALQEGHDINYASKDPSRLLRSSPFLISSPYNKEEHLIDLRRLSKPASLFAQALTTIKTPCSNYAITPFRECLNWDHVLNSIRTLIRNEEYECHETSFFVIEFRSTMRKEASTEE